MGILFFLSACFSEPAPQPQELSDERVATLLLDHFTSEVFLEQSDVTPELVTEDEYNKIANDLAVTSDEPWGYLSGEEKLAIGSDGFLNNNIIQLFSGTAGDQPLRTRVTKLALDAFTAEDRGDELSFVANARKIGSLIGDMDNYDYFLLQVVCDYNNQYVSGSVEKEVREREANTTKTVKILEVIHNGADDSLVAGM